MPRISQPRDLAQINKDLTDRIDALEKRLSGVHKLVLQAHHTLNKVNLTRVPSTTNNLVFTWTGGAGHLSWPAGNLIDSNNINTPVAAGTLTLSPSSFYWLAWNSAHQQMVASSNAQGLLQNSNNLMICQVFTGTAGQTGVAGGGGSTGSSDLSGARYKNF